MSTQLRVPHIVEAVQREVNYYHPELKRQLMVPGAVKSFEDGVAIMAAYVNLVLDGEYTGEDITIIYEHILRKLRQKRGAIAIIT